MRMAVARFAHLATQTSKGKKVFLPGTVNKLSHGICSRVSRKYRYKVQENPFEEHYLHTYGVL